jgi:hypothetical protein
VGLAYFLYVGSPSSKENDDRMEAKIDALLEVFGRERGLALIEEIDVTHLRHGGHAAIHMEPPRPGRRRVSETLSAGIPTPLERRITAVLKALWDRDLRMRLAAKLREPEALRHVRVRGPTGPGDGE